VVTGQDIQVKVRPTNKVGDLGAFHATQFARKHYRLSDNTVVTTSGNAAEIKSFLADCYDNIRQIEQMPRPARAIAEIVSGYRDVHAVASFVDPSAVNQIRENHCFPAKTEMRENDVFGRHGLIGDGQTRLLRYLQESETSAREILSSLMDSVIIPPITGIAVTENNFRFLKAMRISEEYTIGVFANLCARIMLNDLNGLIPQSYGGFLEFSLYSPVKGKWTNHPKHVFYFVLVTDEQAEIISPVVAYDQDGYHGEIVQINSDSKYIFLCRSLFHHIEHPYNPRISGEWKPDFATLIFVENHNDIYKLISVQTTNPQSADAIVFDLENSKFGIDWNVPDSFA